MDELTDSKPKRPLDPNARANDTAMLRGLVGLLNNPEITGAEVPKEERATKLPKSGPVPGTVPQDVIQKRINTAATQAAPEIPTTTTKTAAARPSGRRYLFTGQARSGKSWLAKQCGLRQFELTDPIFAIAAVVWGDEVVRQTPALLKHFVGEVEAWGDGVVSDRYPLTTVRAMFIDHMRESGEQGESLFGLKPEWFGSKTFWLRSLVSRIARHEKQPQAQPVAVTNIETHDQYRFLFAEGFKPFHVMCHNLTRSSRGGSALQNKLAESIERDITKKLSESPSGKKMWCVWCDEKYPMPSPRLMSVGDFLKNLG